MLRTTLANRGYPSEGPEMQGEDLNPKRTQPGDSFCFSRAVPSKIRVRHRANKVSIQRLPRAQPAAQDGHEGAVHRQT